LHSFIHVNIFFCKNYIAIDYMSNDPFTKISIRITRNTYKLTMLHRRF